MDTKNNSIKYSHLFFLFITFILGIVATLLLSNILEKEIIQFSTIGLIGFVLSIILGGASIVLAINAIHLGKSSEAAIIERNDESIKIQNQIFQKTTEALSRIESSTGVTEKRIEDIIAGRAGAIAESLSLKDIRNPRGIEDKLRKSLTEKISPEEREARNNIIKERVAAGKRYEDIHKSLLISLSNEPKIKSIKLCEHGSFGGEGIDLFDGVFMVNNLKIGVSIFSDEPLLENMFVSGFKEFLTRIAQEIANKTVNHFFYLSNKESSTSATLREELKNTTELLRSDLQNRIHIETGTDAELIRIILDKIK
ncbi:MAG: hypothetical protein WAV73_02615 [Candidatus Moraniibacteriota bacterium]